jgi:arylsulfate sulfotransferase
MMEMEGKEPATIRVRKGRKRWIIGFASVLVAVGVLAIVYFSGVLVRTTDKVLAGCMEVPEYDILAWQSQRETDIIADYSQGTYSLEEPYILLDPYEMNPCSAIIIFENDSAGDITVTIKGDDDFSTIQYTKTNISTHVEVPVIGLYAGRDNEVVLTDVDGHTARCIIQTEPLPVDFQSYEVITAQPLEMEPGITLFTACFEHSYSALVDCNGQVRGYLSNQRMAHGTSMIVLSNGNMLSTGDEYKQLPYNMTSLFEFNWLGKIFAEYEIPNGVHHDIKEMPDGNILATSSQADFMATGTREDVVIIIDRMTGEVIREYDFRKILDETRDPYHHFDPDIKNPPNIDWMHINAVMYDANNNQLIISSPIQSQVVCIDAESEEILWILGPHEGYDGSSEYMEKYLLKPTGQDFEWAWCQHLPALLPDMDGNAATREILLFDNGQSRAFYEDRKTEPQNNYSRGVIYSIDPTAMTVTQLWEYGKERGSELYATFLGGAIYLEKTHNVIVTFGGQLRADGVPVDDIVDGVFGEVETRSSVVEVNTKGEVVFEVAVSGNEYDHSAETYQAKRMQIYQDASFQYALGEINGVRKGESFYSPVNVAFTVPNIYFGNTDAEIYTINKEDNRLIIDGNLLLQGRKPAIGRAIIVLRSKTDVYSYAATPSMNGRFFANIDTSQLASGEYVISIVSGVSNERDAHTKNITKGYFLTDYKITIES